VVCILCLWGWLLVACGPPEPVLPGVIAQDQTTQEGLKVRPRTAYEKPPGVYVDVGYLCGRGLDAVREVLAEQLGDVVETVELDPRDGRELGLQRGRVRVKDGRIYQVRVTLDGPLRRSTALQALGLPPTVRKWNAFTREFNTRHHAGFDRIRMGRLEPGSEEVSWVEVRKTDPRR